MNKIYIAAIADSQITDIFVGKSERELLDKLENYLSNERKFNTKDQFENYIEEYYEGDLRVTFQEVTI
jgi:hypothetical protein